MTPQGLSPQGLSPTGTRSVALLGVCAVLGIAACVSDPTGGPGGGGAGGGGGRGMMGGTGNAPGTGNTAGTGTGNSSGTGNSPGSGGVSGTGGAPDLTVACPQPALGAPLLRLLTPTELSNTLNDVFPEVKGKWTGALPAGNVSGYGFDNDASATVGKQLAGGLTDTALAVATALVGTPLATVLPCSSSAVDHACAETFLNKYGRKLFRRPITTAEHDRFLAFFDASKTKSDFKTALKWMTVGLIQSPNAMYRSEIGSDMGNGTRQLTVYEMATALAYTYAGSTPNADLTTKADSGNLGDPVALAKTLLATDPGKQQVQHFFEGYINYTSVSSIQKPNLSAFSTVGADMAQETRAFVNDVVIQKGGGMKELLTAATTNPSKALATYYGFTGAAVPSTDYAAVTRPAGRGIGILAQGSFLATHASSDSSSPTKRGLFPYFRLFCQPTLTPPPNVPQISVPMPGQMTTRQRYESAHVQNGTGCATCHTRFDPMGFAFEHYDEGGRYRDKDGGLTIDASGSVPTPSGTTLTFDGEEQMAMALTDMPIIHQCMAAYLATYAFGSGEACIGASQVPKLQAGAIGIAEAFAQLAAEPHFSKRDSN